MPRHHYVPQFYLREWYDSNLKKFWLYQRNEKGNLWTSHKPSKSVGCDDGLYSIIPDGLNLLSETTNEIESTFFGRIDNEASDVHKKLVSHGVRGISNQEKYSWAVFINSLIERSPEQISSATASSSNAIYEAISELQNKFSSDKHNPRLIELLKRIDIPAATRNTALSVMIERIKDDNMVRHILSMSWNTVDFHQPEHFLTGDTPVIINGGCESSEIDTISIALSPYRLLIMHVHDENFDEEFNKVIAILHNVLIAQQTKKHLISSKALKDTSFTKYEKIATVFFNVNKKINDSEKTGDQ